MQLKEILFSSYHEYIILFLYILTFVLTISLFFLNYKKIGKQFTFRKKTLFLLLIIMLLALFLRLVVFPKVHLLYLDEPLFIEMAKNTNVNGKPIICHYVSLDEEQCVAPPKPPGWPFLISLVFLLVDWNNFVPIYLSSIFGTLSVALIFFVTYLLFQRQKVALLAAFLFSVTPLQIMWSNTATNNTVHLFFIFATLLSFLLFIKLKDKSLLLVTFLLFTFATAIRVETIFFLLVVPLAYILFFAKNNGMLQANYIIIFFGVLGVLFLAQITLSENMRPSLY